MKKLFMVIAAALFLTACNNSAEKENKDEEELAKEDTERLEETSKQSDETSDVIDDTKEETGIDEESITNDQAGELLEQEALGEGDVLTELNIKDDEIIAVIEIADNDIIDDKILLAETIYSRAGDVLLEYAGWEVLTIKFIDVGEVSMQRNEKETNEYGMDYFPLEKIGEQLD